MLSIRQVNNDSVMKILCDENDKKNLYVIEIDKFTRHRRSEPKTSLHTRVYLRRVDIMKIEDIKELVNNGSCFCVIEESGGTGD